MTKRQYYRRPYRIKRKKSIFRNRFLWFGILALIILGTLSYFLFFSDIFQIEEIIITGEGKVSRENIQSFVPRGNILLTDTQKIREDILNHFPQIAEIEIHRGFPDILNVLVVERLAVAIWCERDTCFFVDKDGVIFEGVLGETDLIKITGNREMVAAEKISQILDIRAKLRKNLGITAIRAFIAPNERLDIGISEGWEIYFNLAGDLDWQIQELGLVLEKQISPEKRRNLEYIDLRFNRVYYK